MRINYVTPTSYLNSFAVSKIILQKCRDKIGAAMEAGMLWV